MNLVLRIMFRKTVFPLPFELPSNSSMKSYLDNLINAIHLLQTRPGISRTKGRAERERECARRLVIRQPQESRPIPSDKRITSLLSATQGSKCGRPAGARRWQNKLTTPSVFNYFAWPSGVVREARGLLRGAALSRFPCRLFSFFPAPLRPPSTHYIPYGRAGAPKHS